MYCSSCGIEISDNYRYCPQCGSSARHVGFTSKTGQPSRTLARSRDDKKIAGVCAGIARYLGVDVTLVRLLMVVFAFWPPAVGLIVYLACWIVMPVEPLLLPPPPSADRQAQAASVLR